MTSDIFIWVQHLLGVGHLHRAAAIARGASEAGLSVTMASGGPREPAVDLGKARLIHLPSARAADAAFTAILDAEGHPIDDAWRRRRRDALMEAVEDAAPRVVVLELFPFGRRKFDFELIPLLEKTHAMTDRPLVAVSVRDIIEPPDESQKAETAIARITAYVDRVMVHGDPSFCRLEENYPWANAIADRIVYTGYISAVSHAPKGYRPASAAAGEVIVSAGGGAVGERLYRIATEAAARQPAGGPPWRILVGGHGTLRPADIRHAALPRHVTVEPARPDFQALLARASCSVSQAGYNTVTDILAAGTPAVFVPYAQQGETEQTLRATRLAERGRAVVVPESSLTPERLLDAVACARRSTVPPPSVDLDGIAGTVRCLQGLRA